VSIYTQEVARLGRLGSSHQRVLELVPPGAVVLDVGCASGYLARELVARGAAAVDGVEVEPEEAAAARSACRRVVVGSVEEPAIVAELPDAAYDAILFADVVEHLRHPEAAVAGVIPKLAPGGCIVISVPNVAHYSVRFGLLGGKFRYEDVGLLDRTHLRFFTRQSLADFLASVGLDLDREEFTFRHLPPASVVASVPMVGSLLARCYRAFSRRCSGLLAYQFVVSASPAGEHSGRS